MKLITAHDLLTGAVVYWTGEGWAARIEDSASLEDEFAEEELAAAKRAPSVTNAYLVALAAPGQPAAREYLREGIRARGPTVRPDLGKQAETG